MFFWRNQKALSHVSVGKQSVQTMSVSVQTGKFVADSFERIFCACQIIFVSLERLMCCQGTARTKPTAEYLNNWFRQRCG